MNLEILRKTLEKDPWNRNIHHVHAWNLTDQQVYFEAHVDILNDLSPSEVNTIRKDIEKVLNAKFDIDHTTLQFEYRVCEDDMIKQKD